jgi:hypothetical protein
MTSRRRPSYGQMLHWFREIYGSGTLAEVGKKIGGKVAFNIDLAEKDPTQGFANGCAIRMSYCLEKSGVHISASPWATSTGADGRRYIYKVQDLVKFLGFQFGNPDRAATPPDPSERPDRVDYTPAEYAKNYALSVCIANAFPGDEAVKKEAGAAAMGYFELGSFPVEGQAAFVELGERFLAKPYESHLSTQSLVLMKCIDMYHSAELDELARKYSTQKTPH